jgi:hypothetical protein
MSNQFETLREQASALADAMEVVSPECRTLGLGAAFRRPPPGGVPSRALVASMRQGLDDLLTSAGLLSGAQLRRLASELRTRHGIELDSLQQRRLRRIATIRERGRITSDTQCYLVRSRLDEISGLDTHLTECEALQRLADGYEFRHAKS